MDDCIQSPFKGGKLKGKDETMAVNSEELVLFPGEAKSDFARSVAREHTLIIEFCAPCNYLNLALKLSDEILGGWGPRFSTVELRPTAWGSFEVTLDGELLFSKLARARHPKAGEIRKLIQERLGEAFEYADHGPEEVDPDGFPVQH